MTVEDVLMIIDKVTGQDTMSKVKAAEFLEELESEISVRRVALGDEIIDEEDDE